MVVRNKTYFFGLQDLLDYRFLTNTFNNVDPSFIKKIYTAIHISKCEGMTAEDLIERAGGRQSRMMGKEGIVWVSKHM